MIVIDPPHRLRTPAVAAALTGRRARLGLAVVLAVTAVGCASAGGRIADRAVRDAHRAVAAGDATAARTLYDEALRTAEKDSETYEQALYGAAMTRLAEDVEGERASALLDELAGRPGVVEQWPAVKATRRAQRQLADLEAERARLAAEVEACAAAGSTASGEAKAAGQVADDEAALLRTRLRRSEQELAAARAELAKTEEALRKVKESLVGGGGR